MASENEIELKVTLDANNATKNLDKFNKEAQETVKISNKVDGGIGKLKTGLLAFAAPIAGVVAGFASIRKAISESIEGETTLNALRVALASTGEASEEALTKVTRFSQKLSDLTGIDDDVINGQIALAKSFGITNDQAQDLVLAATRLSVVTGQDVDSAIKQLGGTFDGSIGKLGNLGSAYRGLTKEQLRAGEVVKKVNEEFKGSEKTIGDSFAGSLNKATNAINDLFKAVGDNVTQDSNFKTLINEFTSFIKDITPAISAIASFIVKAINFVLGGVNEIIGVVQVNVSEFLNSVANRLQKVTTVLDFFGQKKLADNINSFATSLSGYAGGFGKLATESFNAADRFRNFTKEAEESSKAVKKSTVNINRNTDAQREAAEAARKLAEENKKFIDGLILNSGDELDVAAKKAAENLKKIDQIQRSGFQDAEKLEQARLATIAEFNEKAAQITEKRFAKQLEDEKKAAEDSKKLIEEQRKLISDVIANPVNFINLKFDANDQTIANFTKDQAIAVGAGILSSVTKGSGGAKSLITGGLGTLADKAFGAAIPGIGSVVSEVASLLAQGPEVTRQTVQAFVEAVPEVIDKIIESLPVLVETLVDTLVNKGGALKIALAISRAIALSGPLIAKGIIDGLIQGAPEFGRKVSDGFKIAFDEIAPKFALAFQPIIDSFQVYFEPVTDAFNRAAASFSEGVNALKAPLDNLLSAINQLLDPIRKLSNGVGGLSGQGGGSGVVAETVGRVGRAFGFAASGGLIPNVAPRGTDTVPMMLTPGELVIPTDLVGQLSAFLSTQNSATGGGTNEAMLTAILSAVSAPMVVQAEAKVNQSAFADIILQLNRQNARLA